MLRVSCIFVADGAKIGQKAEDLLEVEPLVLRLVWAARLGEALAKTEDLSKPEWCFALAADYSSSSPAIKKMGIVTGAVTTRPTPSAVLPKRVKGASTATAVSMLRG